MNDDVGFNTPNTASITSILNMPIFEEFNPPTGFSRDLEGQHGGVHVAVGGADLLPSPAAVNPTFVPRGQMSAVPLSPNDPVFFLHHCNVDRLWAYWQLWQRPNPSTINTQYSTLIPIPGWRLEDDMEPWKGLGQLIKARDVFNWRSFPNPIQAFVGTGYRYDGISFINPTP